MHTNNNKKKTKKKLSAFQLIVNESPPEIINKIDTNSLQGFSKDIKIKILESYYEYMNTMHEFAFDTI